MAASCCNTRNSLFEPTLRIDPSSRPARTRPLAAVFSRSFQSSSSFALVVCSFLVAAGIKALIWPARCPPAGGAQTAGRGESRRQSAPAIRRLSMSTGLPFPIETYFLGLRELCQSAEESQRSGTSGVTHGCTKVSARSDKDGLQGGAAPIPSLRAGFQRCIRGRVPVRLQPLRYLRG